MERESAILPTLPPSARRLSCFFIRCSFGVFFVCVYAPFPPPPNRENERTFSIWKRKRRGERISEGEDRTNEEWGGEEPSPPPARRPPPLVRSMGQFGGYPSSLSLLLFPPLGFSSSVAIMCIHTAPPPPPPLFVPPPEQGCSGEERERDRPTSIYSCACRRRRRTKRKERETFTSHYQGGGTEEGDPGGRREGGKGQ